MSQMAAVQPKKSFSVMYDLHYWFATVAEYGDFLAISGHDSFFSSGACLCQHRDAGGDTLAASYGASRAAVALSGLLFW
jgi:hypothetical protein